MLVVTKVGTFSFYCVPRAEEVPNKIEIKPMHLSCDIKEFNEVLIYTAGILICT